MGEKTERWYPTVLGLLSAIVVGALLRLHVVAIPPTAKDLLQATLTVSAISIGFLATAKSILISVDDKDIVRRIKKKSPRQTRSTYDVLLGYLVSAIKASFVVAALSAIGMIVDFSEPTNVHLALAVLWVYVVTFSALAYYRIIGIFAELLRGAGSSDG